MTNEQILKVYNESYKIEDLCITYPLPYAIVLSNLDTIHILRNSGMPIYHEHIASGTYRFVILLEEDSIEYKSDKKVAALLRHVFETVCINPLIKKISIYRKNTRINQSFVKDFVGIPYQLTAISPN